MEYINKKFLLVKRPQGMPQDDCWKFESNTLDTIKRGEIIIQVKFLSIDPYMRGRMNEGVSYAAPAKIGEPMTGETVGTVVESNFQLYEVVIMFVSTKVGRHN
jgi:NADPH-dependent curcumin reductase CurA